MINYSDISPLLRNFFLKISTGARIKKYQNIKRIKKKVGSVYKN